MIMNLCFSCDENRGMLFMEEATGIAWEARRGKRKNAFPIHVAAGKKRRFWSWRPRKKAGSQENSWLMIELAGKGMFWYKISQK